MSKMCEKITDKREWILPLRNHYYRTLQECPTNIPDHFYNTEFISFGKQGQLEMQDMHNSRPVPFLDEGG